MSPMLFDVFIDDMAKAINNDLRNRFPECLLFADDILLTCPNERTSPNTTRYGRSLVPGNEMEINVSQVSGQLIQGPAALNGQACPTSRHTGTSDTAKPDRHRTKRPHRGKYPTRNRRPYTRQRTLSGQTVAQATRVNVYKTYIRSVLEHGAPILVLLRGLDLHKTSKRGIKKMQQLQDDAVRWIFRKKRHSHSGVPRWPKLGLNLSSKSSQHASGYI